MIRLVLALMASPAAVGAQQSPVPQAPQGEDRTPYSEIELVSSVASIRPGTPFTLAVHITVDPGWHTYWINGGDAGDELLVDWTLPDGFEAGPFQWPAPHLLPAPPLMSYGYEGQVFVLVEITPPADATPDTEVELRGAADFQVCADVCLIGLADLAITLPVRAGPPASDESWAATLADTRSRIPGRADGWTARAWTNGAEGEEAAYILEIAPTGLGSAPAPASLRAPHFFADSTEVIEHAAPQRVTRVGDTIRLEIPRNYFAADYDGRLGGLLVADVASEMPIAWQIEASVENAPPTSAWADAFLDADVILTGGVPQGMAPLGRPPQAQAQAQAPVAPAGLGAVVTAVLLALLGGLVLNLMPCVFPVLSMKVLGFVDNGGEHPGRARRHGFAFGAGVLVCFWLLAGVLMALRAGGESLGWGFQLQSPVIVGLLALLLFGLGLNLSGMFEVGLGLTRLGGVGGGSTYRDSFLMGGLTVVVATPCTAPFMGAALGFALVQPTLVGLVVFTALAVGLAAPYVLLSSMPALLRRLPRPGAWTETLKQALAFPMYATVVWLVWVFGKQAGVDATALLLFGLTLFALAGWVYGRIGGPFPSLPVRASALLLALGGAALAVQGGRGADPTLRTVSRGAAVGWEAFSPERVAALRAEGRPVFIDFTADWCLSCKVNERVALGTDGVRTAFADANVALLAADWTNRDPVIASAIESFGRSGVPLYVMYAADPGREPELLPAVLTPGLVIEAIERAAAGSERD